MPRLTKHEKVTKEVVGKMAKQTKGPVQVNLAENPGLTGWVKKHPRLKPMGKGSKKQGR